MNILRSIAKAAVPHRYRYLFRPAKKGPDTQVRKDFVRYPVQKHVTLDVYWKVLDIGRGPSAILNVYSDEVLRFDCFGPGDGHYHVAYAGFDAAEEQRIYLPEKTAAEQIDRVRFELLTNVHYYLMRSRLPEVRDVRIAMEPFTVIVNDAHARMHQYLSSVPAFEELRQGRSVSARAASVETPRPVEAATEGTVAKSA